MKKSTRDLSAGRASLRRRFQLPNTRTRGFIKEARRQSKLVNESPSAEDDQAFVDSISLSLFEED